MILCLNCLYLLHNLLNREQNLVLRNRNEAKLQKQITNWRKINETNRYHHVCRQFYTFARSKDIFTRHQALLRLSRAAGAPGCHGNTDIWFRLYVISLICNQTDGNLCVFVCVCKHGNNPSALVFFMTHCTSTMTALGSACVLREHFSRSLLIDELLSGEPFPQLSAIWKGETRTWLKMEMEEESSNKSIWSEGMFITEDPSRRAAA